MVPHLWGKGYQMKQLQVTARFPRIDSSNLSEFKRLAGEAVEITKGEAEVIQYDWFFSDDETTCVVRETYADSDAVLAHLGQVGDLLGKIIEVGGGLEVDVFGSPSDELIAATAAMQPRVYAYFQGK
jgi:quinol monooxygenase YgiN